MRFQKLIPASKASSSGGARSSRTRFVLARCAAAALVFRMASAILGAQSGDETAEIQCDAQSSRARVIVSSVVPAPGYQIYPAFSLLQSKNLVDWQASTYSYPVQADGGPPAMPFELNTDGEAAFFKAVVAPLDLSGKDLSGKLLNDASFEGTDFTEANLSGASLSGADCMRAIFESAVATNAVFDCDCMLASFWKADLRGSSFKACRLVGSDYREALIDDVDFTGSTAWGQRFVLARGSRVKFDSVDFSENNLSGIELSDATFAGAEVFRVDFSASKLTRCSFQGARLSGAQFLNAVIVDSSFVGVRETSSINMSGAHLKSVDFTGFVGAIDFTNATFENTIMPDGTIRN